MRAVLILANINKIDKSLLNNALIIGVDRGAYIASTMNIKMDIAIGDFDSVNSFELELIKKSTKSLIKLNPIKDLTDTKEAIKLCDGYSEIIILGGIKGNRIEHFYANLLLIENDPRIKLIDENSLIEVRNKSFIPNDNYKYISFFSIADEAILTLEGFKYNLNSYLLKENDSLCISNEIENNPYVKIEKGRILVIYSKNDHEEI